MADSPPNRPDAALDSGALRTAAVAHHPSLEGVHHTIAVPHHEAGFWEQWRAFVGPAILVSVGYMDPGNWGTDLQGGAQFKYGLLWVVGLASLMAIFMQVISARLGVVTGKDLAQCCRDWYPAWTRWPNWLMSEVAIGACDLAEVLGSAVALNLLFHIPLLWAVIITGVDVLLLLALQRFGMRTIEAVVLLLIATIAVCYFIEIFVLPADPAQLRGDGRARWSSPQLPRGGNVVRRHRNHRRDRHAAQPVPAFRAGAEPQAAEGRALHAQRRPLQYHRLRGRPDHRVLCERCHSGAGRDGVFRQGERHGARRAGRPLQRRQRLDSRRLPHSRAAAGRPPPRARCLPSPCWPADRAAPSPARWPARS